MDNLLSKASTRLGDAYAHLTSSRKRALASAFVFTFVLFSIANAAWVQKDVNDDFTISLMLSTNLPGTQGLCLFVNAALSQVIYGLNVAIPSFNWFIVVESTTAYLSYLVLTYLAFTRTRPPLACVLVSMLTILIVPGCTYQDNFTFVAFINSCAGAALLCASLAEEKHAWYNVVVGLAFLAIGGMWRFEMFLLCIPFFGCAALFLVLKSESRRRGIARGLARLWPFVIAIAVGFSLNAYDHAVWQQQPWNDWMQFNDARANLSDYPHRPYNDVKDKLAEIGMSENDYDMLYNWISEDPEFFTVELMNDVWEIAAIDPLSNARIPTKFFEYLIEVFTDARLILMLIAAVCVIATTLRGRERNLAFAMLAMAFVVGLAFFVIGRLPQRVHYPIWLFAFTSICAIVPAGYVRPEPKRAGKLASSRGLSLVSKAIGVAASALPCAAAVVLLVLTLPHFTPERVEAAFMADRMEVKSDLIDYMEAHPDYVFAANHRASQELKFSHYLRIIYSEDVFRRIVAVGGWNARAPYVIESNAEIGMSNPLKNLAENENAYYLSKYNSTPEMLLTYIREHYYPNATCTFVEKIDGDRTVIPLYVFKFATD